MSLTDALLRPLLSAPAKPLVTHYDDRLGSRVELSVATLANWAAKTANWLVDECDVEPGDPVAVRLPAHWMTAGVLLGAWWCGADVVADPAGAAVSFSPRDTPAPGAGVLAAVSLDPMGRDLRGDAGPGAVDFVGDARAFGDDFASFGVDDDAPALVGRTVAEVLADARERAAAAGIGAGDRVLSTMDWTVPDGVLAGVLAVFAAGASLVQVTGADAAGADRHAAAERTTVRLG